MENRTQRRITLDEYLDIEEVSPIRHEYYRGESFAMAGASRNHNRIVRNLLVALATRLASGPCEPFGSDLRLRTPGGLYTYPDVLAVCGSAELTGDRLETITNPTIVIEVLSPSTAAYDRGEKFLHYIAIPSLREYVLVDQSRALVEAFRPSPSGLWEPSVVEGARAALALPSLGVEIPVAEIYARVEWTTEDVE